MLYKVIRGYIPHLEIEINTTRYISLKASISVTYIYTSCLTPNSEFTHL